LGDFYVTPAWPRWLSLKQAAEYAHLGQKRLKELAREGLISGNPDPENGRGDWIFDRESLDAYRLSQLNCQVMAEAETRRRLGIA